MRIGLDIASLAYKGQINQLILHDCAMASERGPKKLSASCLLTLFYPVERNRSHHRSVISCNDSTVSIWEHAIHRPSGETRGVR
jgi:hypothetical protein